MSDLRTALEVCRAIHRREGQLTGELLKEEARPKAHPMHDSIFYPATIREAAEAHWTARAEAIIQKIVRVVETPDGPIRVREFTPVREQPSVYDPIDEVVQNPVAYDVLLNRMRREWEAMKRAYDHLDAFWQMVNDDAA